MMNNTCLSHELYISRISLKNDVEFKTRPGDERRGLKKIFHAGQETLLSSQTRYVCIWAVGSLFIAPSRQEEKISVFLRIVKYFLVLR